MYIHISYFVSFKGVCLYIHIKCAQFVSIFKPCIYKVNKFIRTAFFPQQKNRYIFPRIVIFYFYCLFIIPCYTCEIYQQDASKRNLRIKALGCCTSFFKNQECCPLAISSCIYVHMYNTCIYRVFRKNCVFSQFTATPPSPTPM